MSSLLDNFSRYLKKTDRFLWFFTLAATIYGMVILYSFRLSAIRMEQRAPGWTTQVAAVCLGLLAMFILSNIDYLTLCRWWKVHTAFAYGLILLTFLFGTSISGNAGWLSIPGLGITVQASEFLKISFILTFAYHIGKVGDRLNHPLQVFLLLLHAAVPIYLVHKLPDDGSALMFVGIAACMLIGAGLSFWYVAGGAGAVAVALPIAWNRGIITDKQKKRILAIYGSGQPDPLGVDWQQDQGLISMGSGGMFGGGLFPENPMIFTAMSHDFIFSYIGQTLGFIGCLAVVILLMVICVKTLYNGGRSVTLEGRMICCGVFGMLALQSIVQIGYNIRLLPVIGVTLPFFSQGGSSTLATLMAMGLVVSVYMHNEAPLFKMKRS